MALNDFVNQYTGQPNVGDTDANTGQCVGLIEVWTDYLGEPHTWGNAKDLLDNADKSAFYVIYNTPGGVPSPGDIFCFDGYYGDGDGHTGIVVSANKTSVTLFEQNDPDGSTPHIKTYSYDHAIGWLHPKVLDQTNQGDEDMLNNPDDVKDLYLTLLGRPAAMTPEDGGGWVGKSWHDGYYGIKDSPEGQAARAKLANAQDTISAQAQQIAELQKQVDSGSAPVPAGVVAWLKSILGIK